MGNKYDVAVIGGGLAGQMAALSAKTAANRVALISKGVGSYYFGPGVIDLLGSIEGTEVDQPWTGAAALDGFHPYCRLGQETVQAALENFTRHLAAADFQLQGSGQVNMLLPTALGTLRPTFLAPPSLAGGDPRWGGAMKIIGIRDFHYFSAPMAADNLVKSLRKRGISTPVAWAEVDLDLPRHRPLSAYDLACWLETPQNSIQLIRQLLPCLGGETRLGFPAVLGIGQHRQVVGQMEKALDRRIFEIPTLPPSVPGMRLERNMAVLLQEQGIEVISGYPALSSQVSGGRIGTIQIDLPGRPKEVAAKRYVLASGGLAGGGLDSGPGWLREPVFQLPVYHSGHLANWSHADLLRPAGQPYARFGLRVNNRLQPVDAAGFVCLDNLYAAGSILAFFDPVAEKSGSGADIATGFAAGMACRGEGGR